MKMKFTLKKAERYVFIEALFILTKKIQKIISISSMS